MNISDNTQTASNTDVPNSNNYEILGKINQMNISIEAQNEKIARLQTAVARPMIASRELEKKSINDYFDQSKDSEYKNAFCNYLRKGSEHQLAALEYKSLSNPNNSDLGYSVTTRMSAQINDLLAEKSVMRKIAKVDEISTDALELIEERNDIDAGWSQDLDKIMESQQAMNPLRNVIVAHELYAQPKVTQRLLDDSRIDIEAWIGKKLIDIFARKESAAFIHGDGVGKPRGILTYKNGKEWGQIETIKGQLTFDGMYKLFFALKEKYAANAKFLMSRYAIEALRMIQDEKSGRYLWNPSIDGVSSSTIFGAEVVECPDMPAVKEGNVVVAFADFERAYQIVDKPGVKILRDPYTGKPYVKYYALKRVGGDVVNFDAIKLLTL